jgi:nucleoside-diphosphate-sugar epimerase
VRALLRPGGSETVAGAGDVRAVDLLDPDGLVEALRGCRAVVHAAARMAGDDGEIVKTNLDGTRNLLDAMAKEGAGRLVFLSTVAVYGGGDMVDWTEDREPDPTGAYATSKAQAEAAVRETCARTGLEAWILRPTTVYGREDRNGFTPFMLQIARDGVIPLVRQGTVRFDLAAAADVAQACFLAATGPASAGEPLHVTSGENLTMADVVKRLREKLGLPARTVLIENPDQPPEGVPLALVQAVAEHRSFSIERARTRLGFQPATRFPHDLDGL